MLRLAALLFGFLLTLASALAAEEVVLGLSQSRVAITANFDGSEILIFGAIKRDTPAPEDSSLGVVVAIEGPSLPLTVRRKEKKNSAFGSTQTRLKLTRRLHFMRLPQARRSKR